MSTISIKKLPKRDREQQVLLGLVDFFLKTGKPVGSHTLKEAGFENLSSATLRNYFAHLEDEGFLTQSHASGGRIPTNKAFRFYANAHFDTPGNDSTFAFLRENETREIAAFLQNAAEKLSQVSQMAVFLSAPRFDQDYVVGIKLVSIDNQRCLCVIITDFGVVRTEMVHLEQKLSVLALKRLESYFHWRLTNQDKPENFLKEEEEVAQKIYNEVMMRYLVSYSNFIDPELYRTGFSKLLNYPDFVDTTMLAEGLGLFENVHHIRLLVRECCKHNNLRFWIGEDLSAYTSTPPKCTVLAIPYCINKHTVGAVGLLGPIRMPYCELFSLLRSFSGNISDALTKNLYKFKITFRQPHAGVPELQQTEQKLMLLYQNKES